MANLKGRLEACTTSAELRTAIQGWTSPSLTARWTSSALVFTPVAA
jgi:hypothetical protein